jgi:hypothetical protein
MSFFSRYVEYLKDNPGRYWFKRKLYGWGWTPARWQGWLTLTLFLCLIVWNVFRLESASHSVSDTLANFIPETFVLVAALIVVCWLTGEPPKWMWGVPKKEEEKSK